MYFLCALLCGFTHKYNADNTTFHQNVPLKNFHATYSFTKVVEDHNRANWRRCYIAHTQFVPWHFGHCWELTPHTFHPIEIRAWMTFACGVHVLKTPDMSNCARSIVHFRCLIFLSNGAYQKRFSNWLFLRSCNHSVFYIHTNVECSKITRDVQTEWKSERQNENET